jgi:hypothetical protein
MRSLRISVALSVIAASAFFITGCPSVTNVGDTGAVRDGSTIDSGRSDVSVDMLTGERCTNDMDCSDGLYCNGQERCLAGLCAAALASALYEVKLYLEKRKQLEALVVQAVSPYINGSFEVGAVGFGFFSAHLRSVKLFLPAQALAVTVDDIRVELSPSKLLATSFSIRRSIGNIVLVKPTIELSLAPARADSPRAAPAGADPSASVRVSRLRLPGFRGRDGARHRAPVADAGARTRHRTTRHPGGRAPPRPRMRPAVPVSRGALAPRHPLMMTARRAASAGQAASGS